MVPVENNTNQCPDAVTYTRGEGSDLSLSWWHGWGHDHNTFSTLAPLFDKKASQTIWDLPGFGKAPMLEKGAGTNDYAAWLIPQLEAMQNNASKHIIVGHSFGCRVAIQVASQRPDLVDGLVLIAAAGLRRKRSLRFKLRAFLLKIIGKSAAFCDHLFKTNALQKFRTAFGSADYRNAGDMRETMVKVIHEDLNDIAKTINVPVLLVFGQDDTETPPEFGERYASLMPNAQLKILSGFDHNSILSRGSHQVQTLMNRFFENVKATK